MRRLALGLLLALLTAGGTLLVHGPRIQPASSCRLETPADRGLVAPSRPASCKPTAPIDIEARIEGDPGAPFAVTAKASSRSGGEVELEIVLPDGATHLGGERKLKGRRCEAKVDARVPDRRRREILVRATTVHGGATLTKVVPLVIFDRPEPPRGVPKRNSRGEALLEFSP
jgi:hypothetical protein